jgi:isochorismate hydrolase
MVEIGGKQIPTTLAGLVDPKRAALLIWDMENAIGPNAFNYKDILADLKSLAALARDKNNDRGVVPATG